MIDKEVQRFMRAASQRYTAAELLLREGLNLEAMYLAGYVVECSLKALILAHTPQRRRKQRWFAMNSKEGLRTIMSI